VGTLIIPIGATYFENVCENVISHLSQIETLVTIAMPISVWLLFNLSLTLLVKSSKLAVKNLIS